jgi:hypothetical protein
MVEKHPSGTKNTIVFPPGSFIFLVAYLAEIGEQELGM